MDDGVEALLFRCGGRVASNTRMGEVMVESLGGVKEGKLRIQRE